MEAVDRPSFFTASEHIYSLISRKKLKQQNNMSKEELKRDTDALIKDIEEHLVKREELYFLEPLRYRFGILKSKVDSQPFIGNRQLRDNLAYAGAILK